MSLVHVLLQEPHDLALIVVGLKFIRVKEWRYATHVEAILLVVEFHVAGMCEGHLEQGLVHNLPSLAEELLDCRGDLRVRMNRVRLRGHYLLFSFLKSFLGLLSEFYAMWRSWVYIQSDRQVCLMSLSDVFMNSFFNCLPPFRCVSGPLNLPDLLHDGFHKFLPGMLSKELIDGI